MIGGGQTITGGLGDQPEDGPRRHVPDGNKRITSIRRAPNVRRGQCHDGISQHVRPGRGLNDGHGIAVGIEGTAVDRGIGDTISAGGDGNIGATDYRRVVDA